MGRFAFGICHQQQAVRRRGRGCPLREADPAAAGYDGGDGRRPDEIKNGTLVFNEQKMEQLAFGINSRAANTNEGHSLVSTLL